MCVGWHLKMFISFLIRWHALPVNAISLAVEQLYYLLLNTLLSNEERFHQPSNDTLIVGWNWWINQIGVHE